MEKLYVNENFLEFANLIHIELEKNKGVFENQLIRVNKPS